MAANADIAVVVLRTGSDTRHWILAAINIATTVGIDVGLGVRAAAAFALLSIGGRLRQPLLHGRVEFSGAHCLGVHERGPGGARHRLPPPRVDGGQRGVERSGRER